mmetsp:Transcript_33576/g.58767  ORF Transcript_33576/g.58767 Transcript_33576/m.58767 type:complete len:128 (+) Transcript_33576:42-425(+)
MSSILQPSTALAFTSFTVACLIFNSGTCYYLKAFLWVKLALLGAFTLFICLDDDPNTHFETQLALALVNLGWNVVGFVFHFFDSSSWFKSCSMLVVYLYLMIALTVGGVWIFIFLSQAMVPAENRWF